MKPGLLEIHVCAARMKTVIRDLGVMDYCDAHDFQLQCVTAQLDGRDAEEQVLLLEHPSVFTLGRAGKVNSLLKTQAEISGAGAAIVHTERGGDITYHGPGQLVVYPIVNLRKRGLSVTEFIHILEEVMILTAADSGVQAVRDARNRGIWVGDNKIGSVGIRIRHGVSFHGLALNVNLSLEPFSWIRPCGLTGVGVTSLEKERGEAIAMERVKDDMRAHLYRAFCEGEGRL